MRGVIHVKSPYIRCFLLQTLLVIEVSVLSMGHKPHLLLPHLVILHWGSSLILIGSTPSLGPCIIKDTGTHGSGFDLTKKFEMVLFFFKASIGGFGNSFFRVGSLCNLSQLS